MAKPKKQKDKPKRNMNTAHTSSPTCETLTCNKIQTGFSSLLEALSHINDFIAKQKDRTSAEERKRVSALVAGLIQVANPPAEATCNNPNKASLTIIEDAITKRNEATAAARLRILTTLATALTQPNASPETLAKAASTEIKKEEESAKQTQDSLQCVARYWSIPDPVDQVLVKFKDFSTFVEHAEKCEETSGKVKESVELLIAQIEDRHPEIARLGWEAVLNKIEQDVGKTDKIRDKIAELGRRCNKESADQKSASSSSMCES